VIIHFEEDPWRHQE